MSIESISIIAAAAGLMAAFVTLLQLFSERRLRRMREEMLLTSTFSPSRRTYEDDLIRLNRRIEESESAWREINHLVISGQDKLKDTGRSEADARKFLSTFGMENVEVDPTLAFVLIPFSEKYLDVYMSIRTTCDRIGLYSKRGDEQYVAGDILAHIVGQIAKARIIIAVLDGRNPNVFYELGIAHALGKPTILVAHLNETSGIPFDLQSQRIVVYDSMDDLRYELSSAIGRAVAGLTTA